MSRYLNPTIFIILIIVIHIGCSGAGDIPISNDSAMQNEKLILSVGVSDWDEEGKPLAGMGLLGIFDLQIDSHNLKAEITPLRIGSLVDTLEVVDITNFLMLAPCTDCIKIESLS